MKVGVVGCGVAGQAAATFLADAGHDVTVFERFSEPRPIGAGLLLQPTGLAVLRALGLEDAALAQGGKVVGLEAKTTRGRIILDLAYADLHPAAHGLGIRRSVLFDLLHDRLKRSPARLVTGIEIIDVVREHGRAVVIDKALDQHGPFDLAVVADGAHSAIRRRLMPDATQRLYPWGCIWTTVHDSVGLGHAGLLRQRVDGTRRMMGLLPAGDDRLTLYWSVPTEDLAAEVPLDLGALQRAASALWPEAASIVADAVAANDFSRATYRNVALPRWNDGPTLFIGDAAHGTSPQLGQGANLALVDAWTLADAVAGADDASAVLARFGERRTATVRFYRQASHLLTPLFQSGFPPFGWARDAFMGLACRLPVARPIAASTLAGLRTGWLSSAKLDREGCYRLK
ncbi:MAG TPA: NAD(P)/FAD-dependent oxidoreductase [Reyranella sp.]|nr:NAD(P)/FAD-dependent oxidoreductase [Reyranella sp.]